VVVHALPAWHPATSPEAKFSPEQKNHVYHILGIETEKA
jgi:hypothetical protein